MVAFRDTVAAVAPRAAVNSGACQQLHLWADPAVAGANIVRQRIDGAKINTAMSNSFGFGGTNASLVFQRHQG